MGMTHKSLLNKSPLLKAALWIGAGIGLTGLLTSLGLTLIVLSQTGALTQAGRITTWLLAADQSQVTWYITRSAGLMAYILLWLSTAWGLAVPSHILDGKLQGAFTFEFHQFISLLAIFFTMAHIGVLLVDQYAPFTIVQILFPFVSDYRPIWVGIGILSFYLILLVTVTFYMRGRIGMKAFRAIHLLSLISFLGAGIHGLFAGTDTSLPAVQILYLITLLSVVFLTTYWLAARGWLKRSQRLSSGSQKNISTNPRRIP